MRVCIVLAEYTEPHFSLDFSTKCRPVAVFEKEKDAHKFCAIGNNKRNGWAYTIYDMKVVPEIDETLDRIKIELPPSSAETLDRIKIELPPGSDETLVPNGETK